MASGNPDADLLEDAALVIARTARDPARLAAHDDADEDAGRVRPETP